MNNNTVNSTSNSTLTHWWWPGQWLRIVYSIWFDQLWYWENIRPHLGDCRTGWKFFIQALLGTALSALFLVALAGSAIQLLGIQFEWDLMFRGTAFSLLFGLFLGIVSGDNHDIHNKIVILVTQSFGFIIFFSIITNIFANVSYFLGDISRLESIPDRVFFTWWTMMWTSGAIADGVSQGVSTGSKLKRKGIHINIIATTIIMLVMSIVKHIKYGIFISLSFGIGFILLQYLGSLWATRQINKTNKPTQELTIDN